MRSIKFSLLLVFILLLSGSAVFQTGSAQDEAPPTPSTEDINNDPKVYIAIVRNPNIYTVSGKVTDENGKPVQGISVNSSSGLSDLTDSTGNYAIHGLVKGSHAISPDDDNLAFSPSMQELVVSGDTSGINFTAIAIQELVVNGGFENNQAWNIPVTEYTAGYSTTQAHSGSRSMRTGIVSGNAKYSYSDFQQTVTIPAGATSAKLYVWLYTQTTETSTALAPAPQFGERPYFGDATESADAQYVMVLDSGGKVLETLIWMRSNNRFWTQHQFNLTKWAGKTIILHFGTYNDKYDGITAMYVDDVSLQVVADAPPPPSECANALSNSGFESNTAWNIPATAYTAGYSTARAYSGSRSMRTGIINSSQNTYSYSDAWQYASIPSNVISAKVKLRYFPISGEVAALGEGVLDAQPPAMPEVQNIDQLHAADLDEDVQYLLLLDNNGEILQTLFWIKSNAQAWKYVEIDLMKYRGKTIRLQFGTGNDGSAGVTAMYVDEMYVDWCTGDGGPDPIECTNLVKNGGFEANQSWYIPTTEFSAGYSTTFFRSGARSMRTGIFYQAHNRYSYSDARQAVHLPENLSSAVLSFYLLPNTNASGNDRQYVLLLDQYGNWIDTLFWQLNDQGWIYREYNLLNYSGNTIQINFGSFNDGYGGVTSLYVDDVRLDVCP